MVPPICSRCGFDDFSRGPLPNDKIVVLLGAGASREAGFPLSAEVAAMLTDFGHSPGNLDFVLYVDDQAKSK